MESAPVFSGVFTSGFVIVTCDVTPLEIAAGLPETVAVPQLYPAGAADLDVSVTVQLLPALEGGEETLVGGQAVLEGVMMRSPHAWAIACRKPSGEVSVHSEPLERLSEKRKWMAWPVIRGVVTLGHAMTLGFRALQPNRGINQPLKPIFLRFRVPKGEDRCFERDRQR